MSAEQCSLASVTRAPVGRSVHREPWDTPSRATWCPGRDVRRCEWLRVAAARPMPEAAPVTSADLPINVRMGFGRDSSWTDVLGRAGTRLAGRRGGPWRAASPPRGGRGRRRPRASGTVTCGRNARVRVASASMASAGAAGTRAGLAGERRRQRLARRQFGHQVGRRRWCGWSLAVRDRTGRRRSLLQSLPAEALR